ncbi:MAG: protein-disulfide reductase DsbD domain-containing protein [Pseudomonadota bacterium]
MSRDGFVGAAILAASVMSSTFGAGDARAERSMNAIVSIPGTASSSSSSIAPSAAQSLASPWVNGFHSRVRLTAAHLLDDRDGTALYAGVDIRLDPAWKTYWRMPGDGGGIPPEFDWSASENVRDVSVLFPAPQRLNDAYGTSIGYKGGVLFPVRVVPVDPQRAVRLRLVTHFGVCDDICIPAEARLSLDIAKGARAAVPVQRDLLAALAKVPASDTQKGLRVVEAKPHLDGSKPAFTFHIASSVRDPVDLFAVMPGGVHLPVPEALGRADDGSARFRVDLSHVADPSGLRGKSIELVATSGVRGRKIMWTVPMD